MFLFFNNDFHSAEGSDYLYNQNTLAQTQLIFAENGTRCATVKILSTHDQFAIEGTEVFQLELEDANSSATCIILESRELAKDRSTTN